VPQVLQAGRIGNRFFTVDRRFSGRSLSGWLAGADPAERRSALISYLDATEAIQRLPTPTARFARLIGDDPREFDSLAELLTDQLTRTVQRSRDRLEQDVPNVIEVWQRLQQALVGRTAEPRLVHGDVCPPNVYLSRAADGRPVVTGIGDFSPHTLVADPLLDVAGAVAFLELEDYPDAVADAAWLTGEAIRRHGPDAAAWIANYRVFYGFYFSDTYEFDPRTYAWCLHQLTTAAGAPPAPTPPAGSGSAASTGGSAAAPGST
jgi:putative membrane protein